MTTALLFGLIGKLWIFILPALGAVGVFVWGKKREKVGAAKERAKQAAQEKRARDIADEIDDAVAGRDVADNRERLKKWSPKD